MNALHRIGTVIVLALASQITAAQAQTITVEAADGFKLIRCIDMLGTASCEFLVGDRTGFLNCVAFDGQGNPVASTMTAAASGSALFPALDHKQVKQMICRK